jgi:sec-independent protein translocase protein TatA
MGSFSLMHWIVVLAIIVVLFGAGKLPRVMGDFAKGIKSFKAGMKEADESDAAASPAQLLPSGAAFGSAAPAARVVDGHTGAGQDNLDAVMGPPR